MNATVCSQLHTILILKLIIALHILSKIKTSMKVDDTDVIYHNMGILKVCGIALLVLLNYIGAVVGSRTYNFGILIS